MKYRIPLKKEIDQNGKEGFSADWHPELLTGMGQGAGIGTISYDKERGEGIFEVNFYAKTEAEVEQMRAAWEAGRVAKSKFINKTKTVPRPVPIMETIKVFNERTGEFDIQQRQKIVPKLEFRYRLSEPELGDQSKVEQYSVFVDTPLFEEREVEIEEQIKEELPIVEGSSS